MRAKSAQRHVQRKTHQRKQQQKRRKARRNRQPKRRLIHPVELLANQGAAPCAGLLPYVRFLRYQLHLPLLLAGLAVKEKGYRLVSLVLCFTNTVMVDQRQLFFPVNDN